MKRGEPILRGFGKRLREAREWKGMSQAELGRRIGVTRASISSLEIGIVNTTNWRMTLICRILRIDANWLCGLPE